MRCTANGRARSTPLAAAAILLLAASAVAQTPPTGAPPTGAPYSVEATVEAAVAARERAERGHLVRVGVWGAASVLGGLALALPGGSDGRRAVGVQSAGWGAVNVAIAGVALASGGGARAADALAAIRAEDHLGHVLLVNLGLNVGYVMVGATLVAVASRGVARPAAWRGHGAAIVVQGLVLLALDGVAYAGSRSRLADLLASGAITLAPAPGGVGVVVGL